MVLVKLIQWLVGKETVVKMSYHTHKSGSFFSTLWSNLFLNPVNPNSGQRKDSQKI